MSRQDTAGTHRASIQSTPGTWFQGDHCPHASRYRVNAGVLAETCGDTGKRLPLYGVVGATFLFAGYSFYFKSQHPDTSSGVTEKNSSMPGKQKEEQAESRVSSILNSGFASVQLLPPTRLAPNLQSNVLQTILTMHHLGKSFKQQAKRRVRRELESSQVS